MAANLINNPLKPSQLYMLQLMSKIEDEDLMEIKKMVRTYLAQKLTRQADTVWEKNGWTHEQESEILNTHLRAPYQKY
ncbi:MAG: hypothetical protein U5N85_02485 [Arcicella sp.]|nr:hypothetical protein [Arcicella sp.]